MDEKELQALYNAMSKQFDVGDWNSFKGKMQTTDQRKNFYDAINKNGYDLGDYNEFEGRIAGTVKKKGGVSEALSIGSSEGAKKPSLSAIGEIGGRAGTSNGSSPQSEKQRLTDFIQGTKTKPTKEDYAAAIAKQDAVLPVKKKEKLTKPQVEEEAIRRFNSPLAIKERQDKKSELPSVPINEDDPIGNRINQIGSEIKNQEKTFDILSEDATDKLNELSVKEKQAELIRDYSIKDSHEAKYITQQLINKNSDTPFEGDLNQYPIEEIQKRVPNTITGKIAFEKYARRRIIDEADFNNATIDDMAAKLYGGENLKDLPEAKAGRLLDEFLSDPDVIEKTKESAAFNNKYNQAKFDLFNKYPSYGFKKVSETIAQKLEDEELTGWLYANPNIDKVQKAVDMLKAEGKWDDKMNAVYEKEIMPSVMVGNADKVIPLTDLSHRFGYGLYEGGTAISNSIRDFTNKATGGILDSKGEGIFQKLGLYDSNEERTQKLEQQQESLPMVEGKRFTTKYLGEAAHFTGFMSPMLLGNAMGVPHLAMTALLFEGNNADKARMHFKDDVGKQNLYTLLSTGIDLFAMKIIPTKKAGDKLKELFKKDAIDIIENLSNNTISRSVAEKTFLEKGTQYLKDVGKGNISTANGLTAFTFLHNTLDAAFGKRDFSLEGELREAVSNYKTNFLSGTFLSGISAIKGREASPLSGKVLREAAENGEIFADMIRRDNKLSESDKAERLGNLEYIEAVDRILQNRKLAPEQREAYLKSSLQQKIAEEKIKASPEKTLSKDNEREVKIAEIEKEHILNPMSNTELLENMYEHLPKANKGMLTTEGKFDENKVGEYLKYVAQQANGLSEDWKPNGKEPSMSEVPESILKAANERWSKEIEASKEPIEGHMKFEEEAVEPETKIEEPTVSETEGAGSSGVEGKSDVVDKASNVGGDVEIGTTDNTNTILEKAEKKGGIYSELAKAIKGFLGNVKTVVTDAFKSDVSEHGDYGQNEIAINNKTNKNKLHIFFHEALHHITREKIQEFESNPNSKNLKPHEVSAIIDLKRIFKKVTEELNKQEGGFGTQKGGQSPKNMWLLDATGNKRGLANVHEFISEAFTNPEFQKILKDFKGEGKSPTIFKQFLDAVAKMLGLKDATILDDIFHHTEKLTDQSQSKQESGGKAPVTKSEGAGSSGVGDVVKPNEKVAELEAERDMAILREGKPEVKMEFVTAKELVDSKDPIGNKKIHTDIKDRYKKMRELLDCLWA